MAKFSGFICSHKVLVTFQMCQNTLVKIKRQNLTAKVYCQKTLLVEGWGNGLNSYSMLVSSRDASCKMHNYLTLSFSKNSLSEVLIFFIPFKILCLLEE